MSKLALVLDLCIGDESSDLQTLRHEVKLRGRRGDLAYV